jgi:F-type H+-transporting ATPase subunit b
VSGLTLQTLNGLMVVAAESAEQNILIQIVTVIICFFLVFWVLKRYAFGPILQVLDERTEHVQNDLNRAEQLRLESEKSQAALEERLRNLERESRERISEAVNEGKRIAASIQENAQKEANEMIEKARQNIQFETERARAELKDEVVNLTLQATERLIKERLDDTKHRQLIGDFVTQIERNN